MGPWIYSTSTLSGNSPLLHFIFILLKSCHSPFVPEVGRHRLRPGQSKHHVLSPASGTSSKINSEPEQDQSELSLRLQSKVPQTVQQDQKDWCCYSASPVKRACLKTVSTRKSKTKTCRVQNRGSYGGNSSLPASPEVLEISITWDKQVPFLFLSYFELDFGHLQQKKLWSIQCSR